MTANQDIIKTIISCPECYSILGLPTDNQVQGKVIILVLLSQVYFLGKYILIGWRMKMSKFKSKSFTFLFLFGFRYSPAIFISPLEFSSHGRL